MLVDDVHAILFSVTLPRSCLKQSEAFLFFFNVPAGTLLKHSGFFYPYGFLCCCQQVVSVIYMNQALSLKSIPGTHCTLTPLSLFFLANLRLHRKQSLPFMCHSFISSFCHFHAFILPFVLPHSGML